ncbi:class I SAM-dependent methyltransferase [Microbacterium sp. H1-D42]|uniref:class I SAM-dependent methyltransferase n=1 Tax=Microbacterium sp. H1-D42 TaxID=2925844 RepID=UPI001F531C07|nr:class I SAM-dependent methyltransferase [Microbacterium sp. H1-D42]UNK69854.1 class I SAM-dependent methyltransferase [Microbacterium sp. H1-D42]
MSDSRATSFGAAADDYEAARPEYPFEAVAWMLETLAHRSRRIADVGAGTGKLTRVLADAPQAEVVAVDPDAAMLAKLRETVPGVPTFVGSAEALPLPDASLDAVVLGQAWHWVDPASASAEVGRVLRPGGTLGLIWNTRDNRVDWVRRLTEVMSSSVAEEMIDAGGPTVAAPFDAVQSERWEWLRPMTRAQLHRMAASRSHWITASDETREAVRQGMDALFDELGLAGDATIDVPYVTSAFRAQRG